MKKGKFDSHLSRYDSGRVHMKNRQRKENGVRDQLSGIILEGKLTVLFRNRMISDTEPAPQYSITIHKSVFLK